MTIKRTTKKIPAGMTEVLCDGPAHENPWQDHCMFCLNHRWGFLCVTIKEAADRAALDAAKAA